jgi:hypothetical protein
MTAHRARVAQFRIKIQLVSAAAESEYYLTNIAAPATNMAIEETVTTTDPSRELG